MTTETVETVFVNGPVQNGDFTLTGQPGKAVGIRLATALNTIMDVPPTPHLWNTVTLTGDLRYRAHVVGQAHPSTRPDFERTAINAKYPSADPAPQILTDAAAEVAALALQMVEALLANGALEITTLAVRVCARCRHMVGTGSHPCRACGHPGTLQDRALHLIDSRGTTVGVLTSDDFHASARRQPAHLRRIAANVPPTLILSRTRDHGISLTPIGLDDLVLDPRTGVHIAALAAARSHRPARTAMLITANAAANVAAYGRHFRHHDGTRLLYALHGRVPYDHLARLRPGYATCRMDEAARTLFETWFLPLVGLKEKNGFPADQLPALLKHFYRARRLDHVAPEAVLTGVRRQVLTGETGWIMNKTSLAAAMRTVR